jgi:hypothetical protein
MFNSLIKQRLVLMKAVEDPEFARLAGSARGGVDDAFEEAALDEELSALTRALAGDFVQTEEVVIVPEAIKRNRRYESVYQTVQDISFWKAAQQYVNLNIEVSTTISKLGGESACLSDAVLLTMQMTKTVDSVNLNDFSYLFDSEPQVAELKRLWGMRAKHITSFAHLALLLDPRSEHRRFVGQEPLIVGDPVQKTWGNTEFLTSADSAIREMADLVLPDTHRVVMERQKSSPLMSTLEVKRALLSGALKAFIGVHEKKKLRHLGISEEKLKEAGSGAETPASFWMHQVPTDCLLREVGIRVLSAKPSSTAVERLWNSFGDNLTAKRRSMLSDTLQLLVYAKMNHHVLKYDGVEFGGVDTTEYEFQTILEFIDEQIDNELADGRADNEIEVHADPVECSADSSSNSGAASDW